MAKKNITTDQLASMVKRGFDGVDKSFKEVHKRFDGVEKRFDRIENVLIKQHSEEIEYLKRRVSKLEEALAIE
ncbi:MAG: hypothetical protein AAB340_02880 [Patescibacteria group bacterium]